MPRVCRKPAGGVGLDLVAVLLASLSIVQGWVYGAIGGLLCGLVMDCVFGVTGMWSLQYMLVGLLVGLELILKAI